MNSNFKGFSLTRFGIKPKSTPTEVERSYHSVIEAKFDESAAFLTYVLRAKPRQKATLNPWLLVGFSSLQWKQELDCSGIGILKLVDLVRFEKALFVCFSN